MMEAPMPDSPHSSPSPEPLESTQTLLTLARDGDAAARERLFARVLPLLTRWAHRRLPASARDLHETDDLVQTTLMRAMKHLERFEHRGEGAFLAYLRQILINAARDEIRRTAKLRAPEPLHDGVPDAAPSALEREVGRETLARYESALEKLEADQRLAVILRVEMGYSHAEIAEALARPSADAARMLLARAMRQLAEGMRDAPGA
jgi:RNA polymerase sigma-70 factor (ECF subfamily)